jgi:hypothetical protein
MLHYQFKKNVKSFRFLVTSKLTEHEVLNINKKIANYIVYL